MGCIEAQPYVKMSNAFTGQVGSHSEPCGGLRSLNVGGNSNTNGSNSVNYGVSYANANNDLTNSNANIGSRLNFDHRSITVIPTLPIGRTQESTQTVPVIPRMKARNNIKGNSMRRRLREVYPLICSMDVLKKAADDACSPRNGSLEVAQFRSDEEHLLNEIHRMLLTHDYPLPQYNIYRKMERGKNRLIADLPLYPHRIIHCAIAIVIEDRLSRSLIHQTHAAIKGRGTHTAMMDIRKHIHNDPKLKYCLTMDIHGYYSSIPPARIKSMIRDYIKDPELLDLMDSIIDGYNATGYPGIALGGRLSPILANLYLSPLDHYLKEKLHVHVMERYMDNYFIFGYSKKWLHSIKDRMVAALGELGLSINTNCAIVPVDSTHGVDVVGWTVYSDHILIRKKTKERMRRVFKYIEYKLDREQELDAHDLGAMNSYIGSLKWFDSYNLKNKIVQPVLNKLADQQRWIKGLDSYRIFIEMNKEEYN